MSHNWFRWYHVEEGDNLSDIALWWFGNGGEEYWRRIWLPNRPVIGEDPDAIRPSMWLKLPFYGSFWYHIEPGDTLFQLAEWVYNHGPNYTVIHQANPWVQDPEEIQPSWWIWVP